MTLTTTDLERAARDERWLGFGYLGGRSHMLTEDAAWVARADAEVIAYANKHGWTYEDLFAWANSRNGRYTADSLFSGTPMTQVIAWDLMSRPRD